MNIVAIIGNVAVEPFERTVDERLTCEMGVAVERSDGTGKDIFTVRAANERVVEKMLDLPKGRRVGVEGRLRIESGSMIVNAVRVERIGNRATATA